MQQIVIGRDGVEQQTVEVLLEAIVFGRKVVAHQAWTKWWPALTSYGATDAFTGAFMAFGETPRKAINAARREVIARARKARINPEDYFRKRASVVKRKLTMARKKAGVQ